MRKIKTINGEKGSILVLVLFGVIILSLIGIMGLNKSKTEISITRNFTADKTAFFTAESGLSMGTNMLRFSIDPPSVIFGPVTDGNNTFRSGALYDNYGYSITDPQYVTAFLSFTPPPPIGISLETSGSMGVAVTPWILTSSSSIKTPGKGNNARKEITSVVVLLSSEY
ncbi:MAG: pilus assembly PilX N-terminal domain-containing protein [Acidobacteriota bacterium]